jgi:lipopolysaccharide biosynthesis protein
MSNASVCLYSSYVAGNDIPYYVRFYLEQLKPHFTRIIYITNERKLNSDALEFLSKNGIESMTVANEGYDFGMWHKALNKLQSEQSTSLSEIYEYIGLINDSCVLFKDLHSDFEKMNNSLAGYSGMIISERYATHIQSFFLIIRGKAIDVMTNYFNMHGLVADYREVIQTYEIGLTQEMIRNDVSILSLYNNANRAHEKNPSFALVKELLEEGMPLIKKKIVFRNYRGLEYYWVVRMNFDTDYRKYVKLTQKKYGTGIIDFNQVMRDAPRQNHIDLFWFAVAKTMANIVRAIPGSRWLFHQSVKFYKKYIRKQ